MPSPLAPYPYSPLKRRSIRLLELLPNSPAAEIQCKLHHVSLDSNSTTPHLPYEALSYAWGTCDSTSSIVLLGSDLHTHPLSGKSKRLYLKHHRIRVTENLLTALHNLRRTDTSRILWIDALCINQAAPSERSAQVSLMHEIYQNATRTVVFLGPEDPLCARASAVINRLAAIDPAVLDLHAPNLKAEFFQNHPARGCFHDIQDHEAFALFLSRPWWSRVWVVQEVVVAQDVVVVWGAEALNWEVCAAAVHAAVHYSDFVPFDEERFWMPKGGHYRAHAIVWARLRFQHGREVSLFNLLNEFSDHDATDPRDKVYALLGLVVGDYSGQVEPDYMTSWEVVYGEVVANIVLWEGNMDPLAYCSGVGAKRRQGLPTWVPDWTRESSRKSLIMMMLKQVRDDVSRDIGRETPDFCASGPNTVHYDIRNNSGVITLVGISIGTVSELSGAQDRTWSEEDLFGNWGPIAKNLGEEYRNGEPSHIAFARTICANQFNENDEETEGIGPGWYLATMGRKFMLNDKGYMGLVPADTREGDIVTIVKGAKAALVLRPEYDHFLMVGEAYGESLVSRYYNFGLC
jgi:hypothetical protein